ncbi:MAG TPA: hypothetical protein G4O00_13155, partial [Thermoflexia bacterium]|nr:hypothetical protein [Thermoflexia bacterium]
MRRGRGCELMAASILLVLTILACNLPGQPTVPPTATPIPETGQATPTPPPPEEPSPTPAPDITAQTGCTLNGAFVADVTVPDNSTFPPNTPFTKTWRLRNTGTCT